jgi:hypothetical protein
MTALHTCHLLDACGVAQHQHEQEGAKRMTISVSGTSSQITPSIPAKISRLLTMVNKDEEIKSCRLSISLVMRVIKSPVRWEL